jgi:small-conductance mechanosensitive channel
MKKLVRVSLPLLLAVTWAASAAALQDVVPPEVEEEGSWWTYRLINVGGTWITVRKLVVGFTLLVVGYFVARFLSGLVRRGLLGRPRVTEGGAAIFGTVVFYLLLLVFTFSALNIAGVPLTAFTLLGGAAAIGVGFGSQNIVNNFISGLILLAERPINVGNLIEVGDLHGTVEHIGPRSTRVRTGANVEIVVPNSTFLESNVVNWTLSETRVRVNVSVGVAYGSPTERVADILRRCTEEHERVLATPAPIVLFGDFGDNALVFEVHFWIEMRRMMDRRMIESDVRFRVDEHFREAGIVIAFPQRDVHLSSLAPIDVRVQSSED